MDPSNAGQQGMSWLAFSLMTVVAWGLYGVLLHSGQTLMKDPVHGRYKAFLFVGIAYFLTAVVAPMLMLWLKGATWSFSGPGMAWSLLAGIVGAVGAFCVLLAFGAGGMPSVVMSIIFAGAPIINATVALSLHPPAGGLSGLRWQFVAGILLAAVGGYLVTMYKPSPAKKGHAPPSVASHAARESTGQG